MKISFRILLINFAVVVAILAISAAAFYSVMNNTITSQQTRYLLNSANNFFHNYQDIMEDCEDEFLYLEGNNFADLKVQKLGNLDFILQGEEKKDSSLNVLYNGRLVHTNDGIVSLSGFLEQNPYAAITTLSRGNVKYYIGKIFNEPLLNTLSQRIGSEIALISNNSAAEISNSSVNRNYYSIINHIEKKLAGGDKIFIDSWEQDDIIATRYTPDAGFELNSKMHFIIFTKYPEASDLKSNLTDILFLIGATGVILSLILSMLFTHRMRSQITGLSHATEVMKEGNFSQRILVQSTDELGSLGNAFNTMLDVLAKNEQSKNEYSEFITLINQNPTLNEISEAALQKIIKSCGYAAGVLYTVEVDGFHRIASFGFDKEYTLNNNPGLFRDVITRRVPVELNFEDNLPQLVSGMLSIKLRHLLIQPIIYNYKVIAILELASVVQSSEYAKEYLSRIQHQLAIGLTNALALVQLENLVSELQKLNVDYQKQNLQIRTQNETLVDLHKELKEKADELALQKQKAEEATELKSQFLASMSHELRTPMNSILGLTELILEESSIAGKNRERLEVVLKSGKRLMNLINDILDLSKIEAGKMEIHEEDLLLEEVISEVETSVSPLVINKKIEFGVERGISTNIMITTDRGKLMQILINLIGNAVKFTEQGSVELIISSAGEDILQFDIKDTGIGISESDQKHIFSEFTQADGTTTRKYGGTGLGLAISSRICSIMNGTLSLQSKIGEGSTFTLRLPVKKSSKPIPAGSSPFNVETLVKNRKNPVLVIDDDEDIRFTIGQYLNSKGYDVIYAENGYKGINEAVKQQPFAITLDLMLPNKDGWTTLRELKENPLTKDIPVILISILGDKKVGYGLGAFEYFVKPIAQDELLSAMNKLENLAQKRIEKIVIVDDDELEYEKFRREFKNERLRINYIKESEFAFSKILEIQPDLVIIDLLMPNIDGITLSHKLKSNKETRHIPIIISTAKDISDKEKDSLQNIVENITVKSKGHPLDVLKIVRDRIKMQEVYASLAEKDEYPELPDKGNGKHTTAEVQDSTSLNVLIVDDDPDALYTLDEIVQSCDCRTVLAKNGYECLSCLEEKVPDLVLLDIMMPGMDGFQTLKKIRANRKWDNIPVYAVTAKAMLDDKGIIMKYGFDDYIFKPVNAGMLAFKLKKLLFKLRVNQ